MSHVYHTMPMESRGMNHDNFVSRAVIGIILSISTAIGSVLKAGNLWAVFNPDTLQAALTSAGLVVMFLMSTFYTVSLGYFWFQVQSAKTAKQLADIAAGKAATLVADQVTKQVATAIKLTSDDDTPAYKGPGRPSA